MKRSTHRILTTHVGSLPRSDDMLPMLSAKMVGDPIDERAFEARLRGAVVDIVRQQVEHGLDVINDGEVGKPGFILYAEERLGGFERREVAGDAGAVARARHYLAGSRELLAFPEYYQPELEAAGAGPGRAPRQLVCTGPVSYRGHAQLQRDIENLRAALREVSAEEAFIPAVSPNQVAYRRPNEYYRTDAEYEAAVAEALREEYLAIVEAGFLLQVDDPQLVTHYMRCPELSIAEYRRWAEQHVELLNHALRGIPRERVRYTTLFRSAFGPRVHDLELRHVVDILVKIHAGAHSFEAANPRHEHEWKDWASVALPDDTILIPGVVTQASVTVEHPELVAQRIERFAALVGRERVIAGVDCGFASTARSADMPTSIVWAKLDALAEGARIASQRLWKG